MRHQTTLRFIDAIARAGSIRRASERMAITPSALNRRLLAVEEEMDAQLFERLATGVRLSAAGELFLGHARRQMADMERIRSQIEDMKGARRGHVSFGVDTSLAMESFAEAIGRYQEAHPNVTFEVDRMDRSATQAHIADYRIDLACVIQPEVFPNLTTLAVAPANVVAVMDSSHPLAGHEVYHLTIYCLTLLFFHRLVRCVICWKSQPADKIMGCIPLLNANCPLLSIF